MRRKGLLVPATFLEMVFCDERNTNFASDWKEGGRDFQIG